jgi:pimeloyl-ACP methyl ester carboxylesterase
MAPFLSRLARAGCAGKAFVPALNLLVAVLLSLTGTLARAALPVLAPSPFADGTQVDTAVLGYRIPVILVHGLGGSTEGWDRFLRAYEQSPGWRDAFKPYSFRFGSTTAEVIFDPAAPRTISALGAALRDAMQGFYDRPEAAPDFGFGNKRVIVLAHSMGGLVARSMMQEHVFSDGQRGGQKVLHLITLGTPHHGTPLADAAIALGLHTVSELDEGYFAFVADTAWTNFDGLNMSGGRCNHWLAQLNNYAPATGGNYGRCGAVPANPLPGYYWKIIAYGASALQNRDWYLGETGVYKPGSSTSLLFPYNYLRGALPRSYPNDGIVPLVSAQLEGASLWLRRQAYDCDHRYIRRGYPEFVRSPASTYTDWAFCAGTDSGQSYASGISGGYAVSGSIMGVAGGIVDTIKTASEMERVLNWVEWKFPGYLAPAGATSDIVGKHYYRYYSSTEAYLAVSSGNLYFLGAASGSPLVFLGTLGDLLPHAQAAGF